MEIIRLAGYPDQEKYAIARQFLVPKQLRANGLDPATVEWETEVIPAIVQNYTREAGVRELERRVGRIARKLARREAETRDLTKPAAASGGGAKAVVRASELKDLLGVAPFDPSNLTLDHKVGVVTGLAYTAGGGDVLEIEVSVVSGRGKLQLTGTLGDVMKESASAALSYARSRAKLLGIDKDFHRARDLHIH